MINYWKEFFRKKQSRSEMFLLAQSNIFAICMLLIFTTAVRLFISPSGGHIDFLINVLILTMVSVFILVRRYWSIIASHVFLLLTYFFAIIARMEEKAFYLRAPDLVIIIFTVIGSIKLLENRAVDVHVKLHDARHKRIIIILGISCFIASLVAFFYLGMKANSLTQKSIQNIAIGMYLMLFLSLAMLIKRIIMRVRRA